MENIWYTLGIGVAGSLVATALAAVIILISRQMFSAKRYIETSKRKVQEIEIYAKNPNLVYIVTLRDLVIMNVLFFADSAAWNFGEVLIYSNDIQGYVRLINEIGLFSIRVISVMVLMVGIWVAWSSINRINRVLFCRSYVLGKGS